MYTRQYQGDEDTCSKSQDLLSVKEQKSEPTNTEKSISRNKNDDGSG